MLNRRIGQLGSVVLTVMLAGCALPARYCGDDPCAVGCGSCDMAGPLCCDGVGQTRRVGRTLTEQLRYMRTCGAGCGDVYWGEWSYDPPDACDPCDACGNWIGPACCPPRGARPLLVGLLGRRFAGGCADSGCLSTDCDDGYGAWSGDDGLLDAWETIDSPEASQLVPSPPAELSAGPMTGSASRHPQSRLVRQTR
jgi:hypothetical protein